MSLTRDEWIEMWKAIKRIELQAVLYKPADVQLIKDKIQSVVGQLE